MRLLFLNHNLRFQGTWFRAWDFARLLAGRGHEVCILTGATHHYYRLVDETPQPGIRVIEYPSWNPLISRDEGWNPVDIALRLGHVLCHRYDAVLALAHPPAVAWPARLAIARGMPCIADWCDLYDGGIAALREDERRRKGARGLRARATRRAEAIECRMELDILRRAGAVTVISSELRRRAVAAGAPEERVHILRPAPDFDFYAPRDKAECRRALGLPAEAVLLGYVANYNPDEELLLAALGRIAARHPGLRLLARCPEFDPDLIREHGLVDRILPLPPQSMDKIPLVLGAADILLLPMSDHPHNHARWPQKFGEYLAAGRPVLSSNVGDTAAFYEEAAQAPIGAAAAPDPAAWAEALQALLAEPEKWEELGRNARALALRRLDPTETACRLEAILQEGIRASKSRRGIKKT